MSAYLSMLGATGMERGVLVQPSVYGVDNRLVLDAVRCHPERLRAVVVVDAKVQDRAIADMHAAGARGFRINLLFKGGVSITALQELSERVAEFGWHAQLLIDIRGLDEEMHGQLNALPVPVVFDHMGHFPAALGTEWEGFRRMVDLALAGRAWIKLSGAYRVAPDNPSGAAVRNVAEKLLRVVPERLVWGSDWPHVGLYDRMPDTLRLQDDMVGWMGGHAHAILVRNPEQLYGFSRA